MAEILVRVINAKEMRDSSLDDEEFGLVALHEDIPKVIPKGEIWVADDVEDQRWILDGALARQLALDRGANSSDAYDHGLRVERAEQEKYNGIKLRGPGEVPAGVRQQYLGLYKGLRVWSVDGPLVRETWKTDFTQGGHDLVYPWIPGPDEVWLESDLKVEERPDVLLHEGNEHGLMADGMGYDEAHRRSSRVEFAARERKKVLRPQAHAVRPARR
jgi:hypothetical protein